MRTPTPTVHIAEVFPALQGLRKETVRLHPRQGGDAGLTASKMGGVFLWPKDEPWPRCTAVESRDVDVEDPPGSGIVRVDISPIEPDDPLHNDYLVGILQLRHEDVPGMDFYPGSDLCQLLWCPRYHPDDITPFCRIYWRRAGAVTDPRVDAPRPRRTDDDEELVGLVPRPCTLSPERVIEYPPLTELPETLQEHIAQWEATADADGHLYEDDLSIATGTKGGGYARNPAPPPTCPACQRSMAYLLTVASAEWGSGGRERWCPEEERYLLSDDPSIDFRARQAAVGPSVFLSRGFDLNVFICRHHSEWPIAWSY